MRRKRGGIQQASCVLAAVVLLSACTGNYPPNAGSPYAGYPQPNLPSTQGSQFTQTVGVPAALGGVTGAVAGGLLCKKNRAACAAGGAAAGGLLGAGAGYVVAGKNQSSANREQELRSLTQSAQQQTDYYRRIIADTNSAIEQYRQEIGALRSQYQQGQVRQARYQQEAAKLQSDITVLQGNIKTNEQTIAAVTADLQRFGQKDTGALVAERDELVRQRDLMQRELSVLLGFEEAVRTS
jgi:hypothetical protein